MTKLSSKNCYRLTLLCVVILVLGCSTMLSRARTQMTTITVTNNSSRTITHVYLSPPASDNWSADQLSDNALAPGASVTISNASCGQDGLKIIAEDQDGCFASSVIDCSGDSSWTITNASGRDCGS
jgi:hypothetical protein